MINHPERFDNEKIAGDRRMKMQPQAGQSRLILAMAALLAMAACAGNHAGSPPPAATVQVEAMEGYLDSTGAVDSTVVRLVELFRGRKFAVYLQDGTVTEGWVSPTGEGLLLRDKSSISRASGAWRRVSWAEVGRLELIEYDASRGGGTGFWIGFLGFWAWLPIWIAMH